MNIISGIASPLQAIFTASTLTNTLQLTGGLELANRSIIHPAKTTEFEPELEMQL